MGLPKILKKLLPAEWVYQYELRSLHKTINSDMSEADWRSKGSPLPPPNAVKWAAMRHYAKLHHATVFVETGTFMGDTTFAMRDTFEQLHTVEFDAKLYQRATTRFAQTPRITVWHGDGGATLPEVLKKVSATATCVFWLDGHYSGGVTGKATANTSVTDEVKVVYAHGKQHVILIDDARLFNGTNDYPSLESLTQLARTRDPDCVFSVQDDIIRITPKP